MEALANFLFGKETMKITYKAPLLVASKLVTCPGASSVLKQEQYSAKLASSGTTRYPYEEPHALDCSEGELFFTRAGIHIHKCDSLSAHKRMPTKTTSFTAKAHTVTMSYKDGDTNHA